jgi:hypothetical protein
MKKTIIVFLCTCFSTVVSNAQPNPDPSTAHTIRTQNLAASFTDDTVKLLHFPFADGLRQMRERISGWSPKQNKKQGVSMRNLLLN